MSQCVTQTGCDRPLTAGEKDLTRSMFKDAIDLEPVRMCRRKWFWFQPKQVVMAPQGHVHFHPDSQAWSEDFSATHLELQGLFIHEMTHVWQTQKGMFLPLQRPPICAYNYRLRPGWPLTRYNVEQQAEIVRHAFLLRAGLSPRGSDGDLSTYESLLPF